MIRGDNLGSATRSGGFRFLRVSLKLIEFHSSTGTTTGTEEHGESITLVEVATRFEEAGISGRARALSSLKRCQPGRPPVYRDWDRYRLDLTMTTSTCGLPPGSSAAAGRARRADGSRRSAVARTRGGADDGRAR
jgi:hypothetical protein